MSATPSAKATRRRKKSVRRMRGEGSITTRVEASGKRRYVIRVTIGHLPNGKPFRPPQYANTEIEAVEKLKKMHRALGHNIDPRKEKAPLGDYMKEYVEANKLRIDNGTESSLRYSSWSSQDVRVRHQILGHPIALVRLCDLTKRQFDNHFNTVLVRSGVSTGTRILTKQVLSAGLNAAVDDNLIPKNPLRKVKIAGSKQVRSGATKAMTTEQGTLFLQAAAELYPWDLGMWELAILRTLRAGELLGLTWKAWNSKTRKLLIHQQLRPLRDTRSDNEKKRDGNRPKGTGVGLVPLKVTQGRREILIPKRTAKLLDARRASPIHGSDAWNPMGLIFQTDSGMPRSHRQYWEAFGLICRKVHIAVRTKTDKNGFSPHDLRATAATQMILRRASIDQVRQAMGHTTEAMTLKYLKLITIPQMETEMVDAMENAMKPTKPKPRTNRKPKP